MEVYLKPTSNSTLLPIGWDGRGGLKISLSLEKVSGRAIPSGNTIRKFYTHKNYICSVMARNLTLYSAQWLQQAISQNMISSSLKSISSAIHLLILIKPRLSKGVRTLFLCKNVGLKINDKNIWKYFLQHFLLKILANCRFFFLSKWNTIFLLNMALLHWRP